MRNAFEVLAAGAKRKHVANRPPDQGGNTKTPAASKGCYTTCPLCQRTVPLAFAEAHVSVCLSTPGALPSVQQRGDQATPAGEKLPSPAVGPTPSTQAQRQRAPSQPKDISAADLGQQQAGNGSANTQEGCQQEPQQAQRDLRASSHNEGNCVPEVVGAQSNQQCERQPAGGAVGTQPAQDRSAPAGPGPGSTPPGSQMAGPSAFDIMRKSQLRAASRCHTFFLERTPDGAWLGHCWAKGCATPAQQRLSGSSCWSVTLTVAAGGRGGPADGTSGKETVCLQTNVAPGDGGVVSWSTGDLPSNALPPEGRWRGGFSPLKSALQKAVRLGRGGCAVRAALHLAKEEGGAAQLLRRLSIVCVEDAILHPGLPLVVWLMAAQAKGFTLGATHLDALLRLVYQLATVPVRDGLPNNPWYDEPASMVGAGAAAQGPVTLHQVDDLNLPPAEACLVKCLLMRASYGGMGGDVLMMRGFAAYWAARFKGEAAVPPPIVPTQTSPSSGTSNSTAAAAPAASQRASSSSVKGPVSPPSQATCVTRSRPTSMTQHPMQGEPTTQGAQDGAVADSPSDAGMGDTNDIGGGAHLTRQGPSQPFTQARVSEAYFAARLQAEDAPPTCGAFIPASQLLAEAVSEQQSMSRLAASTAATRQHQQGCQARGMALASTPGGGSTQPGALAAGHESAWTQPWMEKQQQQSQPAGAVDSGGAVVSRWYCDEASASEGPAAGSTGDGSGRRSAWLKYICDVYDQVPVPAPLSRVACVGPLRRSDVPLSAVDFHVSDVVTQLLGRPELMDLALSRPGTTPEDAEDSLKSAMWLFRSSKNPKAWVHALSACCRAAQDGACSEHRSLGDQLAKEARNREALGPLWAAAAPWADRYSTSYIARRFGPP